jgi:hypothetical protein
VVVLKAKARKEEAGEKVLLELVVLPAKYDNNTVNRRIRQRVCELFSCFVMFFDKGRVGLCDFEWATIINESTA